MRRIDLSWAPSSIRLPDSKRRRARFAGSFDRENESMGNLNREKRARVKRRRNPRDCRAVFVAKKLSPWAERAVIERRNCYRSDSRLICASTGTSKSLILGRRFTDEESDQDDEFFSYAEATGYSLLVRDESFAPRSSSASDPASAWQSGNKMRSDKKGRRVITSGRKTTDPFRDSLFPNVPPYVRFHSERCGAPSAAIPKTIVEFMRWKFTASTPPIVRRVVEASGFRSCPRNWSGSWENAFPKNCEGLTFFQKVNHFPGTGSRLGRKDQLCASIDSMARKFGRKDFGFAPETFVLPRDRFALMAAWKIRNKNSQAGKSGEKWIVKPASSARGYGVRVVGQWWEVPANSYVVVQRYLARPMLINGAKFDIRIYVLVTSFDPLRVYLYSDGLVRIATARYDTDAKNHRDRFVHLTNTSVNKYNGNYSPTGHLWPLKTLWRLFELRSIAVERIWEEIKDIVAKTLISVESAVAPIVRRTLASRYTCFELFGFDILIEEDLRPWLLEVNTAPSLQTDSNVHRKVKGPLVRSVLNIAGFQLCPRVSRTILDAPLAHNFHLYDKTRAHRATRKQFNCRYRFKTRGECRDDILGELTPDDVRLLVVYEDEITQLGLFEKIFPTPDSHRYLKYFSGPGYYDLLLDAWERDCGFSRSRGIRRLRDLCGENYHLMP